MGRRRLHRRALLLLLVPVAMLLAVALVVPRLVPGRDDRRLPPPVSGVALTCPRLVPTNLEAGLARVATETQNLGDGVFGKSIIYSDGVREVSFHIGYEVIEKLEDLDFDQRPGRIASRDVTIYDAKSLPPGSMVAAEWSIDEGPEQCSLVTVVARNFTRAEFERFVSNLEIRSDSDAGQDASS
jgi:hypothetical protein